MIRATCIWRYQDVLIANTSSFPPLSIFCHIWGRFGVILNQEQSTWSALKMISNSPDLSRVQKSCWACGLLSFLRSNNQQHLKLESDKLDSALPLFLLLFFNGYFKSGFYSKKPSSNKNLKYFSGSSERDGRFRNRKYVYKNKSYINYYSRSQCILISSLRTFYIFFYYL